MALVLADRVEQVTRTTGLGDLVLGETLAGRQSFQDVTANGDTVIYVLEDVQGTAWEIGEGTVIHGTETTLQRTTIRQSSNSDAKISLSAGTHRVFLVVDATYLTDLTTTANATTIADTAVTNHESEADPHTQYLLDTTYDADQLRASLLEEATLYADFANGDYRLWEGVGSGLVRSKTFGSVFDFTRGSGATGYGVGNLETVTTDVARRVYSPETNKRQGLLIEEQRTNILTFSDQFDNAAWGAVRVTISPNIKVAPDGVASADKLVETTEASTHLLFSTSASSLASTVVSSVSVFVKSAGDARFLQIVLNDSVSASRVLGIIDPATGDVDVSTQAISATSEDVGDGWRRFVVTFTSGATTNNLQLRLANTLTTTDSTYTGDGTSGVYIWGAQLEQGALPTSYIKTEVSQVTRAADNCSRTLGAEFNASEGTLYIEFLNDPSFQGGILSGVAFDDALAYMTSATNVRSFNGSNVLDNPNMVTGLNRLALIYDSTGRTICLNGVSVSSPDNSFGDVSTLRIGFSRSIWLNDSLPEFYYIPRALSTTELEALTS